MSIERIAFALPRVRHTAQDIGAATGADPAFILGKVGLSERFVLGEDETAVSLATAAVEKLALEVPVLREQTDLLVVVTQNPGQRIPHASPAVAAAVGLPATTATFDISLGCSGYVYGMHIAEGFLRQCAMRNAVLITCDPYSRIIRPADRDTNCVFGDAATATWLQVNGERSRLLAADFGSDGAGGAAISLATDECGEHLTMKGRLVYNFVLDRIPGSVRACLAKASLRLVDVDYFVFHQASAFVLNALADKLGVARERVRSNMSRYGNVVSSSIPLLLAEMDEEQELEGRVVLLCGFGVGLSWATSIVKFN